MSYQLAVLDELLLTSLSEPQQRALRPWVEERGGGLVTITGTHGVGRDPELLREIEPIRIAVDLDGVMVPASIGEARRLQCANRAVGEGDGGDEGVIHGDGLLPALRSLALGDKGRLWL